MTVSTTIATTAASTAPTKGASLTGADAADQFNMFLKLLTTQMQNQDPLDPMDTSQYTQQLAQYSQIEQSIQQTGLLKDVLARMSSADMTDAAGLIGRTVEFDSKVAALSDGSAARWNWMLPQAPGSVTAEIRDSSGKLVATPTISATGTSGAYSWDGKLPDGSRAPAGAYVLKLTAKDNSGNALSPTTHSLGTVQEVVQRDGELWLGLGGAVSLPLSDLSRISATQG
ncbi:flagellar hook assembly protein FlgD [Sphingomonas sp. BN140010]|uniref:Basal-body rod modification protein FlgD n=1 Tax=Sphingomonas arvum TaxID=2992113 RepID=A0ABT3JIF8_9SPHN|nr:flagellar hook capping FlgD N-terminal domain-containing protein [Sphingomonas sp. BN140010]MCW3798837.1 flagellar hook assembly protein FlgD [Sphingomonas sp. BN140010]